MTPEMTYLAGYGLLALLVGFGVGFVTSGVINLVKALTALGE